MKPIPDGLKYGRVRSRSQPFCVFSIAFCKATRSDAVRRTRLRRGSIGSPTMLSLDSEPTQAELRAHIGAVMCPGSLFGRGRVHNSAYGPGEQLGLVQGNRMSGLRYSYQFGVWEETQEPVL